MSEAIAQKKKFYDPNTGFDGDRYSMLRKAGLYNRQILATGILYTTDEETHPQIKPFIETEEAWLTRNLNSYDTITSGSFFIRRDDSVDDEDTDGVVNIKIHRALGDEPFERIYKAAGVDPNKVEINDENKEPENDSDNQLLPTES